ncbi:MAG: hypothetical protein SNJ64_00260 [Endomicrobiia bacterium]
MNKNEFKYIEKPKSKLKSDYYRRVREGKSSFKNFSEFYEWYQKTKKICHYCGLKEEESQEIVMRGLLKSKRFPQNGQIKRGQARGVWLEVDRLDPKDDYKLNNVVLCCYFCNNDKSDVFNEKQYKAFSKNRVKYLRELLKK